MSLARSIAVVGIGLGALAVATEGFVGAEVEGQDLVVGHVVADAVVSWQSASGVAPAGSVSVVGGRVIPDEVEASASPDVVASSAVVVG